MCLYVHTHTHTHTRHTGKAKETWPIKTTRYHFTSTQTAIIKKTDDNRSSCCGTAEMNLTGNHEVAGSIPGLAQ